jgi:hypothetical protein
VTNVAGADHGAAVGTMGDGWGLDVPVASALTKRAIIAITVMMMTQRTVLGFMVAPAPPRHRPRLGAT